MKSGELVSEKYRLVRRLGSGGMAEVWAATNIHTERHFAIKLILPAMARKSEASERFCREARAAGRLRHPNIVDVFDVGTTPDGRAYQVMELLSGESLESRLAREGRLDPVEAALLLSQVARGLEVAHRAGVVHRDLSTANVFLTLRPEGGEPIPKIVDFGVSKILEPRIDGRVLTMNGAVLGSPAYMSPEQARGAENVDARTDVWSLGVLIYECLSGKTPFRSANYNAMMVAILSVPHTPLSAHLPGCDPELVRIVESCLVKDPEARTQTALEVAESLETFARRYSKTARRRRASDRLPIEIKNSRFAAGACLPEQTFPLGIRVWKAISRKAPPGGLLLGGALGGSMMGLAIGVFIASSAAPGARTIVTTLPALPPPPAIVIQNAPPPPATVVTVATDLGDAVAKSLGVPKPRSTRPIVPVAKKSEPDQEPADTTESVAAAPLFSGPVESSTTETESPNTSALPSEVPILTREILRGSD